MIIWGHKTRHKSLIDVGLAGMDITSNTSYHGEMLNSINPMLEAAECGDVAAVTAAMATHRGPRVLGRTLCHAAMHGHIEVARILMDGMADVHVSQDKALRIAAGTGNMALIRLLLDAGADLHIKHDAPLRIAAFAGNSAAVIALLAAGADIHAKADCALSWAAMAGNVQIVHILLDANADVHAWKEAALRWAAGAGKVDVVRILLASGGDPVAAWAASGNTVRRAIADSFGVCADAMTPAQRAALAARSRLLIGLRAHNSSMVLRQQLCR